MKCIPSAAEITLHLTPDHQIRLSNKCNGSDQFGRLTYKQITCSSNTMRTPLRKLQTSRGTPKVGISTHAKRVLTPTNFLRR